MLIRARVTHLADGARRLRNVLKSTGGLWLTDTGQLVRPHHNVLALLGTPDGDRLLAAANIITTAGDVYYSQRSAGETPTNAFGTHFQASAGPGTPGKADTYGSYTAIAGSVLASDATYPKTNDTGDADNTGDGVNVVTWRRSYATTDFNHAAITHGGITIPSPVAGSPLLCGFSWGGAFAKTASDTLKVIVNHTLLGA